MKVNYNKYEVMHGGFRLEEHYDTIRIRWYFRFEFKLTLAAAGFNNIEIFHGYESAIQGI